MRTRALILAACVASSLAVVANAQTAEAFERAYRSGDWELAAVAGERWAESEPENPTAAYNTACAFSLAGDGKTALSWLRRAGEVGFAGTRSIEEDPDLDAARELPGFEQAVAAIRANRERMFEEFRHHAEQFEIFTILPSGAGAGPKPLVVVLHGYGGRPEADAKLYRKAARELGAIIAAPSALRPGPEGRGFSWTFRDEAEWWVLRAIDKVSEQYEVDRDRIVLAGFSQGANVALSVGLKHPERFAGILPIAGHYERHLMPTPNDAELKVFLLIGENDPFASTFSVAESMLRQGGTDVRLRVVPGLGHSYPIRATHELRRALEFLLPSEPASPASD